MRSELEGWLGLNADPFEDQYELVSQSGNGTRVWRVSSRCRECGERWTWLRYSCHRSQTGYDRCAECAARMWHKDTVERVTRENELRRAIEEMAASGRLRH